MLDFSPENNLTIIPARAGSKRIPNKNMKWLLDKPLLFWTIDAALSSGEFKHIMVSTDSEEIARIAVERGAIVPSLRSRSSATDDAPTRDAIVEAIDAFEAVSDIRIAWVTLLQPTSPFRTASTICRGVKLFKKMGGDSVVSVKPQSAPLNWLVLINPNGYINTSVFDPECAKNDVILNEKYHQYNGALYICSRETIVSTGDIYSQNILPLIMTSHIEGLDIDTPDDWELAECIATGLNKN